MELIEQCGHAASNISDGTGVMIGVDKTVMLLQLQRVSMGQVVRVNYYGETARTATSRRWMQYSILTIYRIPKTGLSHQTAILAVINFSIKIMQCDKTCSQHIHNTDAIHCIVWSQWPTSHTLIPLQTGLSSHCHSGILCPKSN